MFLKSAEDIAEALEIKGRELEEAKLVEKTYPALSTSYYASLSKDAFEAIKAIIFPSLRELDDAGEEDPFAEEDSPVPFLKRKYPDRVLLITTNSCAVLCRYCMRKRNWKKKKFAIGQKEISAFVKYIKGNNIRDVLISGGDPLMLSEDALGELIGALERIDSVEVVRIGTKMHVAFPQRAAKFLDIFKKFKKLWISIHATHPVEITDDAKAVITETVKAGAPVLTQTVLLKGVNDNADTLLELFSKLRKAKAKPYYLFRCDPVKGAFHFATPVEKGIELMRQLLSRISPMALPFYAVDTKRGKVILMPDQIRKTGKVWKLKNYTGGTSEVLNA